MKSVLTIVQILGGAQGLFLTLVLISFKKDRYQANKYLSAIVFVLSLTLIISFLHFTNIILHVPHLMGITPIFILLYGPLLFFYVSSYLKPEFRFTWKHHLHFLPFLIQLGLEIPYLSVAGWAKKEYLMNIFEDRFFPIFNPESLAKMVLFTIYLILCYLVYKNALRSQERNGPPVQRMQARWIARLLAVSFLIWGSYMALYFYDLYTLNSIIPTLITVAFYSMGYMGFKYPEILRYVQVKTPTKKYESSKLTPEAKDKYCEALQRLMRTQRVFIDPELKMSSVAYLLKIPTQNLSQIINEKYGQNFSEFVNTFRIHEAQRMLLDSNNRHLTILAIAYEVGFNSKSAFNAAFKKLTNQTPSEFTKTHPRTSDSQRAGP